MDDLEPDRVSADVKCVVEEMLPGLDVVLVFISPVEQNLFTVVGHCELLLRRVTAHAHEVAIIVVAGEELVDMVEDPALCSSLPARLSNSALSSQIR